MLEQQEVEFDIYYQGSTAELYSLLYPLGGPNSHIFAHLNEHKVTFDPKQKHLTYTYEPDNFENIDKQKEQIKYTSKPVQSLSNYFYSTFHEDAGCFVWRNVNRFLEMRPENRRHETDKSTAKKDFVSKSGKKQQSSEVIQAEEQASQVQLQVIESGQATNTVEKQISQAPITQVKPVWHCSKDEYFSYLAN